MDPACENQLIFHQLPFKDSIVLDANLPSSNPRIELGIETSKGIK